IDLVNGGNNFQDVLHLTASSRVMDGAGVMFGSVSGANGMGENTHFLNDARSYNQVVTTGDTSATTDPYRIKNVANSSGVLLGSWVTGTGIPGSTTVTSIDGTSVTMSSSATATNAGTAITFKGVPSGSIVDRMWSFGQPGEGRPHTFNGGIFASSAINASNISGSNSGDVILLPAGTTPSSSAATLINQQLAFQPATNTTPGYISSSGQTIGGPKTFTGVMSLPAGSAAVPSFNLSEPGTGFCQFGSSGVGFSSATRP